MSEIRITVDDLRFIRQILDGAANAPRASVNKMIRCMQLSEALDAMAEGLCHDDYIAVVDGVTTLEHG